jgi:hypothetical protein
MRRKKGGDCGCGKKIFGGYGAASYQGGINNTILPLNNNNGSVSDPLASGNITEERFAKFVGGKKSRKNKKSVRFGGMSTDLLLGNFGSSNPLLNSATSSHAINAAQVINGQKPF